VVETNRRDKKNAQYEQVVKQGDLLLNCEFETKPKPTRSFLRAFEARTDSSSPSFAVSFCSSVQVEQGDRLDC